MMKLRFLLIALSFFTSGLCAQTKQADNKPNILFIFADDQMFNTIGALENCPVKTPNLDRLVDQGVFFSHTFNQGSFTPAVCVASRTMLVTGGNIWRAASYSKKGKNINDPNAPKNNPKYNISFKMPDQYWPQYLKEAGYDTYMSGKWHVGEVAPKDIFDYTKDIRPGMPNQTPGRYARTFEKDKPDTWSPYDKELGGFWKGGKHWSEVLADNGIEFLEQAKTRDNPFFMYLAFNAPHDPKQAPKRFVDMYVPEEIKVPENFISEYPYNEYAGSGRGLRDEKLAPFPRTPYSVQINRQEYFASISHMDEQVGKILAALEASGKAENTYVFFTADHGLAIGDHGFMGKQNMYDSSMRVPMIMCGPKVPKGKVIDDFVYLQDIMPTTLELAGLEKPSQIDFNSLLPLATGNSKNSHYPEVYGAYFGSQRMYRTKDYKMIIYPTANIIRLYDMNKDPMEMNDLAEHKQTHQDILRTLFKDYKTLQTSMKDPLDLSVVFENFMNNKS